MTPPLAIAFRETPRIPLLETVIRRRFESLVKFCPTLQRGRIVVEETGHRTRGGDYRIRLTVELPGDDIVVEHQAAARSFRLKAGNPRRAAARSGGTIDLTAAIRRTFDAVRRRLQDRERRLRGDVKVHSDDGVRKRA